MSAMCAGGAPNFSSVPRGPVRERFDRNHATAAVVDDDAFTLGELARLDPQGGEDPGQRRAV